jgi:recombination protein RecT
MHDMSNAVAIRDVIYEAQDHFIALSGGKESFEREAGFALQVLQGSEYASKVAMSNKQSVINAVTNIAAIGISLNPAKRQAYLVPRDGKICLDISFMGLLDLAIQSGSIMWGQAELVYEKDRFELQGFDKPPIHHRDPFAKDRGPLVGVYVVVKTRDADYLTTCMSTEEVFDIRDRSSSWKNGQKGPWKTDEGEMVKKTVIKRAYKLWPKTDRLDNAVHFLNTEGGEGLAELAQASTVDFRSSPMMGAMEGMDLDQQNYLRDLAECVKEMFNSEEAGVAIAFDKIEGEKLDGDQKVALWSCLPSNVRSGLKKEGEARKKLLSAAETQVAA